MSLRIILFSFHFALSAGFSFDSVEGNLNATVGIPFPLAWHTDGDQEVSHFEQTNSSQSSGQGVKIQPDNNATHSGTVTLNFPSPGGYTIEAIDNKGSNMGGSPPILAINPDAGNNISLRPSSTASSTSTAAVTTSLSSTDQASSSSASSSSLGGSTVQSSSHDAESSFNAGSPSTTNIALTSSSDLSYASDAVSPTSSESPLSSSSSSNPNVTSSATSSGSLSETPKIVGATVGSFVFLLLLLGALVYTLLRRQHRRKYRGTFHRDRMVRKHSNASFSPLTPTAKDSNTYTNFADIEKRASGSSIETEDTATGPDPKKECSEYSLPALPGNRSETPSPVLAHTDRQMELHDILVKQQTELIRLKTELRRGGDAQEEIDALKARIVGLEDALVSPWALRYTDDVPVEVSRVLVLM
ncbi:uncharacterized protein EV420DRAFT_1131881 [Desarmillaria tabescens]|uniref:Mid2 domain-containing protein n=1 Tax=Armillaria tabescens TaxID=1929756 RepID=A0AA39JE84_ARMTA|nr:uncharacterized protein EV420DRAFT_1131881 [Desarmillaria tabescens]KAK0440442.1 hypothetical protein EV420DRAFT_1131881 [Desarmillaria tabescens]